MVAGTHRGERLWAPWRSGFVRQAGRHGRCIFCAAKRSGSDRAHLVIARGAHAFAMLNLYPYNTGHLMMAPYRHVGTLEALRAQEWADFLILARRLGGRLRLALRADGLNLGLNLGRVAGAGIPGHVHLHMVPRWRGDTNFMPIVAGTKVMSQSLEEVYRLVRDPSTRAPALAGEPALRVSPTARRRGAPERAKRVEGRRRGRRRLHSDR